ncbi:hypothetical protein [Roseovarius nanhaiticus]|uniref:hypothetical protein n=1 Tax=Roseovarius nanhaiticus TaxID=573024 RepID=UPI002490FCD3|nr:hypothetical protein [Roseovarius nanhaiticus]
MRRVAALGIVPDRDAFDEPAEDLGCSVHDIGVIQHLGNVINRRAMSIRQVGRDLDGVLSQI